MEFWSLYRTIRKRLWMVLFLVVVTVASTAWSVMTQPPSYKATSTIRVAVTSPSVSDVGRLDWYTAGILFSTIQETVLSRTILQEVMDRNFLTGTSDDFRKAIGVTRVGNSNLLKIDVKSTDPEEAKRLANDISATFIRYNQKLLDTQSASSIAYYEEQVKLAEQNYNRAKEDFRNSLNQPNARAAENQFIGAQGAYQSALDKLDAAKLINQFPDLRPSSVGIAEPAITPTEPEGRQLGRYVLIATLVSLVLGIFIAMGIEYLDTSVKSPYEVASQLGVAVLGVIPHFRSGVSGLTSVMANLELPLISRFMRWRIARSESRLLPPDKMPQSSVESFRKLRLNLVATHRRRQAAGRTGATALVVTSSRPRDGKTTVTANLGIALSRAGYRVLLLDADLRKPELHRYFGLDGTGPGMANLLRGDATFESSVRPTPYQNLVVVVGGAAEDSPVELLDTERLSTLIARAAKDCDFILCDTPALGVFSDAAMTASRLGQALLVVDAARLSADSETRNLSLLTASGATIEGVVVNKINPDCVNPTKLHELPRHLASLEGMHNGKSNGHSVGTNGQHDTIATGRSS